MSKKTLTTMIENKNEINYKIVDDVSIGVLMHFLKKEPALIKEGSFLMVSEENGDTEKIIKMISEKPYIFYRNRNSDRKTDVKQMRIITGYLLKNLNF